MYALLILNRQGGNARFIVRLEEKVIKDQVVLLLEENRGREAFDLLKRTAEVDSYLPSGAKLPVTPQVTLVEDLL